MQIVGIYDIIDKNCHVRKKNIEILVKRLFTKKDMTNFFGNLFNKSFSDFHGWIFMFAMFWNKDSVKSIQCLLYL